MNVDNATSSSDEVLQEATGTDDSQIVDSENRIKIDNLTEDYVAPLLSADFSDILNRSPEDENIEGNYQQENEDSTSDEDFDIDALIADAAQSNENHGGDDDSLVDDESLDIGDDLVSETFDEDTLTELLEEDEENEYAIELSPDFSDQNVLADLLNDNEKNNSEVSEANEIDDIQELDNLNFDELLANIEEESSVVDQVANFNHTNDELTLEDFDNFNSNSAKTNIEQGSDNNDSFVSVDSLLTDSQDDENLGEPYEKANIDVGLNEFPEFTDDVNPIDVDIDENGIAAKLDLAKVYLEIGDEDNASVILKEIIKLGDPQQQAEAQNLLSDF